jgi:hypothetical protein
VSQWIEEAKSKLKDPGLVYSYHGGGRNRNAEGSRLGLFLPRRWTQPQRRNSCSELHCCDSVRSLGPKCHLPRNRSGLGAEYAAPCEPVRWWRIICDESHSIRSRAGKSDAVLELVADGGGGSFATNLILFVAEVANQMPCWSLWRTIDGSSLVSRLGYDFLQLAGHY